MKSLPETYRTIIYFFDCYLCVPSNQVEASVAKFIEDEQSDVKKALISELKDLLNRIASRKLAPREVREDLFHSLEYGVVESELSDPTQFLRKLLVCLENQVGGTETLTSSLPQDRKIEAKSSFASSSHNHTSNSGGSEAQQSYSGPTTSGSGDGGCCGCLVVVLVLALGYFGYQWYWTSTAHFAYDDLGTTQYFFKVQVDKIEAAKKAIESAKEENNEVRRADKILLAEARLTSLRDETKLALEAASRCEIDWKFKITRVSHGEVAFELPKGVCTKKEVYWFYEGEYVNSLKYRNISDAFARTLDIGGELTTRGDCLFILDEDDDIIVAIKRLTLVPTHSK